MSGIPPRHTPDHVALKKLFQLLLVSLGCLHLAGGPYLFVQGIAWAGMLVSYSKEDGLIKGTIDTFSGEKPCALCCKIAEAKKGDPKEKPAVPPGAAKSLEMLPVSVITVNPPRSGVPPRVVFAGLRPPHELGAMAPPSPPPKGVA